MFLMLFDASTPGGEGTNMTALLFAAEDCKNEQAFSSLTPLDLNL